MSEMKTIVLVAVLCSFVGGFAGFLIGSKADNPIVACPTIKIESDGKTVKQYCETGTMVFDSHSPNPLVCRAFVK